MLDFIFSEVCLAVVFLLMIVFILSLRWSRRAILPPGPKLLPIVGSLDGLSHVSVWDHKDKYGDISYLYVGGTRIFILNSIDVIREAYASGNNVFNDRPQSFVKKYVAYEDVVFGCPSESHWRRLRQTVMKSLRLYTGDGEMEDVITNELVFATRYLDTKLDQQFDIAELLESSVSNMVYLLLINERFEYNHRMIKTAQIITNSVNYMMQPFVDVLLRFCPIIRMIPFGPGKHFQRHIKHKRELMEIIFNDNKSLWIEELDNRSGLVFDLLKELKNTDSLTENNILGGIDDILEGGIITTKWTLYTIFLILIHHPKIQQNIHDELDKFVGRDRRPCLADRRYLNYTQAFIYEAFRYGSNLPFLLPHCCSHDSKLNEFAIPKGSVILANAFRVHHDADLWDNPWDFEPWRFLDEDGVFLSSSHPTRKNLIAFSLGARACLGDKFAQSRVFLYVVHILHGFLFIAGDDLPSCDPRSYVKENVIHPEPYELRVKRRF